MTDLPLGRWDATLWAWDDPDAPPWDTQDEGANDSLFWAFEFDWDNDHVFDGSNESMYVVHYEGGIGRNEYLRIGGDSDNREAVGFAYFEPGTAKIVLNNNSRRYTPNNASSPLYPNVKKGRDVRVSVKLGIDGSWRRRFSGTIDDIKQVLDESTGDRLTEIYLVDHWRKAQRNDANVALTKNVRISEAIDLVLDAMGWPSYLGRNIDLTTATLPYWWTQGRRAITELRDLADGDLGHIFVAGDGTLTFQSRNNAGAVATTITESELLKGLEQSDVADAICNKVQVQVKTRQVQSNTDIARISGDTPFVPAGETLEVFLPIQYDGQRCPADNILTPVAGTDYAMNTLPNGSGTDLTANFTVTLTDLGGTLLARVTNNGGTDGYITLLKAQGQPVTSSTLTIVGDDLDSQADNGILRLIYSSDWLQNTNEGDSILALLLRLLADSPGFFDAQLQNQFSKQFEAGLMDVVELTLDSFGVSAQNFKVGRYYDTWNSPTGQSVTTEWRLEPINRIVGGEYFTYDASLWEVDTIWAP